MPLNTEKHSFTNHLEAKRADKHNSDLTNLAQAFEYADAARRAAQALIVEINHLAQRIESGELDVSGEVRKLYERAGGFGIRL